jgi:hypothetical protein
MIRNLANALASPQTTVSRTKLLKLAVLTADVADIFNQFRAFANLHIEGAHAEKIVERIVEVPAKCPEPVSAPETSRSTCAVAIRSAARRWASALDELTNSYSCMGCKDGDYAKDAAPVLRSLSFGGNTDDPVSVVVGLLAQYRQLVRMNQREQARIDDRVQRVAADMRAQLAYCGIQQPDFER